MTQEKRIKFLLQIQDVFPIKVKIFLKSLRVKYLITIEKPLQKQNMNTNKIVPIWRKEHKPPTVNKYYKTRWCNSIKEKKTWQNLEKCGYAHNNQELRKTPEDPYPEEYLKKIQDMYKKYYLQNFASFRTMICRFINEGKKWRYGEIWQYAHWQEDLRKENQEFTAKDIEIITKFYETQDKITNDKEKKHQKTNKTTPQGSKHHPISTSTLKNPLLQPLQW